MGKPSAVSVILDITVKYGGEGLEYIVAILTERALRPFIPLRHCGQTIQRVN